jgi:lysophospholipase L1-like esterase
MTAPETSAAPAPPAVRAANALIGVALVAYALSDDPFYGGAPGFGGTQAAIAAVGAVLVLIAGLAPRANANTLFLVVVCGVLLGGTELAAERLLGPAMRPPYDYDARLLFKLRPGARSLARQLPENGGGAVEHQINALGFRGPELTPAKSKPRVVVYGDSFIHATYTPEGETFVRQLERSLSASGPVEVINGGVSSYGPDQILLRFDAELPLLQPDLVVLSVFAGNDYGDLMRNKIFRVGDDGALAESPHQVDPEIITNLRLNATNSVVMRTLKNLKKALGGTPPPVETTAEAKKKLVDFWLETARKEYDEHVVARDPIVRNTHIDHYSADLSADPSLPSSRYKVTLMRLVLERIAARLQAAKVPFLLIVIPHPMDVAEQYEYSEIDAGRFPTYDRRNLVAPLESWARTSSVPLVSVFDTFTTHGDVRGLYLRGGDDHWNSAGQKVAAEAVAQRITQAGLLRR